jgi:hypothetical protein
VLAVVCAFVMLGLLSESLAEALLEEHRAKLESQGRNPKGELSLRDGVHGYWDARVAKPDHLANTPLSVVASRLRCPTSTDDVYIDWVTLTPSKLRLRARAVQTHEWADGRRPGGLLDELVAIDDLGRALSLRLNGGVTTTPHRLDNGVPPLRFWTGEAIAEAPGTNISWVDFSPTETGRPERIVFPPPASVPVGRTDPQWPTPAECYLAWLIPEQQYFWLNQNRLEVAPIVATVADGLLAVGALPPESELLRSAPDDGQREWHRALRNQWSRRITRQRRKNPMLGEYAGLTVSLPFEDAVAVIEGIGVEEGVARIRLYGFPWVFGSFWPVNMRSFDVKAVDDQGNEYFSEGRSGRVDGCEGRGDFVFWPPVSDKARNLRVIVSTLWETAWADIELPSR